MFETYYYIDEEKLDCYLSDFSRSTKNKKINLSLEVTLPFIKVTANGEFSKEISDLSPRQKAIFFESILDNTDSAQKRINVAKEVSNYVNFEKELNTHLSLL